ncbi:MAG: diacylglycerol kinase family protein [Planctomycetaceae bacterium]
MTDVPVTGLVYSVLLLDFRIAAMSTILRDDPTTRPKPARDAVRQRIRRSRKRSAWRQWLIEAERGITAGFRSDSVFFVHLFAGSLAVAAAVLLGLDATQWGIVILALSMTIASELFHQVLKQLGGLVDPTEPAPAAALRRFGAAAVAVATIGSVTAISVILGSRLWTLFEA